MNIAHDMSVVNKLRVLPYPLDIFVKNDGHISMLYPVVYKSISNYLSLEGYTLL